MVGWKRKTRSATPSQHAPLTGGGGGDMGQISDECCAVVGGCRDRLDCKGTEIRW